MTNGAYSPKKSPLFESSKSDMIDTASVLNRTLGRTADGIACDTVSIGSRGKRGATQSVRHLSVKAG